MIHRLDIVYPMLTTFLSGFSLDNPFANLSFYTVWQNLSAVARSMAESRLNFVIDSRQPTEFGPLEKICRKMASGGIRSEVDPWLVFRELEPG